MGSWVYIYIIMYKVKNNTPTVTKYKLKCNHSSTSGYDCDYSKQLFLLYEDYLSKLHYSPIISKNLGK